MIKTGIFPSRYIQGPGAIVRIKSEIQRLGGKGFVISSPRIYTDVLPKYETELSDTNDLPIEKFNGECCDSEIDRLAIMAQVERASVIVGIGGGKTLDTAKAVAHTINAKVIISPSLASSDAPCSASAVLYTEDGEFDRYMFFPQNPDAVIVDTEIIAKAPPRFLSAGMGDALATYFEAQSCQQSYAVNMTGDHGPMTSYFLAELCLNTLLENGVMALQACEAGVTSPALEKIVEANTLLSGLGFESGGLAAAHAIHNGLTVLDETHEYLHGEKVAFGTLASLVLTGKSYEQIIDMFEFCKSVNLPITLEDIGLKNSSDLEIMKVAEASCAEGETIFNEPAPISPKAVFDAIKAADAIGRKLK
jgi:glycerol dehydrogenase